jgi:hypothetical protein
LHKKIENYSIPKSLREKYPNLPKNLKRSVFIDDEELPTAGDLPHNLSDALQESKVLILICSPNATGVHKKEGEKNWVDEEIKAYKRFHGEGNILAMIKAGEPNATYSSVYDAKVEAFPKALRYEVDAQGELTETRAKDPIAGDARSWKPWERRKSFIKLIAGILGVDFADLWERDKIEQRKRWAIRGAIAALFVALSIYSYTHLQGDMNNKELERVTKQIALLEYSKRHDTLTQKEMIALNDELEMLEEKKRNLEKTQQALGKLSTPLGQKAKEVFEMQGAKAAKAVLTSREAKALRELKDKEESLEYIAIARLDIIDNNYTEATKWFEKAVHEFFDYDNVLEYARFLYKQNEFKRAVVLYEKLQTKYLTKGQKVAVLNNLAILQKKLNQNQEALGNYGEALQIRRALAKENPSAFNPDVAMTLNNLANLQVKLNQNQEALGNYGEALQIRRALAKGNPSAFNYYVATTLNNLANLQVKLDQNQEALGNYGEALQIRRALAKGNPSAFNPDVAMTLNNLAILQVKLNQNQEALKNSSEAIQLYKKLADSHLSAYGIAYVRALLVRVWNLGQSGVDLTEAKAILQHFRGHPEAEELLEYIQTLEQGAKR